MSIESQWTGQVQAPVGTGDETVDGIGFPEAVDEQPDLSLPEPPLTGDDAVDRAVAEVAQAVIRPLEDQVAVIDAAHRTLQDRLADVEG